MPQRRAPLLGPAAGELGRDQVLGDLAEADRGILPAPVGDRIYALAQPPACLSCGVSGFGKAHVPGRPEPGPMLAPVSLIPEHPTGHARLRDLQEKVVPIAQALAGLRVLDRLCCELHFLAPLFPDPRY